MSEIQIPVFLFIYQLFGPGSYISGVTIFFAVWFPFITVISALIYELFIRDGSDTMRLITRIYLPPLIVLSCTELLKLAYPMGRPFAMLDIPPAIIVSDPFGAFPSTHAAFFSALAVTMYFCNPRIGKWFFGAALAIGFARIGVGVHWPVDIIAGLAIGTSLGYVLEKIMLLLWKERAPKC